MGQTRQPVPDTYRSRHRLRAISSVHRCIGHRYHRIVTTVLHRGYPCTVYQCHPERLAVLRLALHHPPQPSRVVHTQDRTTQSPRRSNIPSSGQTSPYTLSSHSSSPPVFLKMAYGALLVSPLRLPLLLRLLSHRASQP